MKDITVVRGTQFLMGVPFWKYLERGQPRQWRPRERVGGPLVLQFGGLPLAVADDVTHVTRS